MNIKMKKLSCMLLAVLMLVSVFACNGGTESEGGGAQTQGGGDPNTTAGLPDMDMEGYQFRVYSLEDRAGGVYQENLTGDIINDAVYNRNKAIEQRYNCTITVAMTENTAYPGGLANSIQSQAQAFDMGVPLFHFASAMVSDGFFLNVIDMPNIDLSKPWWCNYVNDDWIIDGKLYTAIGDFSSESLTDAMCIFFNKNVVEENNVENLYQLVYDGKWTLDKLIEVTESVGRERSGNGVVDPSDLLGWVGESGFSNGFQLASDQPCLALDENNKVTILCNTSKMQTIVEKVYQLSHGTTYNVIWNETMGEAAPNYEFSDSFVNGNALFTPGLLSHCLFKYNEMVEYLGVLPFPKFDENQESYYTGVSASRHCIVIPNDIPVADREKVGLIIEALMAYGSEIVRPAVYEKALKYRGSNGDPDNIKMLDIILDTRRGDLGEGYLDWSLCLVYTLDFMMRDKSQSFTSYIQRLQRAITRGAQHTFDDIVELEQ